MLNFISALFRPAPVRAAETSLKEGAQMQRVSDAKVDRGYHVWYQRQDGSFKCVLCGGVTRVPTDVCECRYEELTKDEKEMCPPRDPKDKRTAEEMSKAERREEKKGKRK